MITLGLVEAIDSNGIYVTLPGSRGVLRGPFETLQNVVAGDKVLVVTTDDGDCVVVGLAAAAVAGVSIPDGSITSAKIANGTIVDEDVSSSAAISRSKISGLPTSSTDNTIARFDGTGGALQGSGVTITDGGAIQSEASSGEFRFGSAVGSLDFILSGYASGNNAAIFLRTGTAKRWFVGKEATSESGSDAGSNFRIWRYHDDGSSIGEALGIRRDTGKVTIGAVGSTAGLEFGSSGPRMMVGTGGPSGISAPVGSTWRQTDANSTHGSLKGLLWNKVGTGTTEGTDWLVDYEGRWVSYTPTITASGGSFTTVSGSGSSYTRQGKTAMLRVKIVVTTVGTATGGIIFTLPSGMNANADWMGWGRQDTGTGVMLQVRRASTTTAEVWKYDNTSPIAVQTNVVHFNYEIA